MFYPSRFAPPTSKWILSSAVLCLMLCTGITFNGCMLTYGHALIEQASGNRITTNFMLCGYCYGASGLADSDRLKFELYDNRQVPIDSTYLSKQSAPYLVAVPDTVTQFFKYRGMLLVLGNPTSEAVAFEATNGCLSIVQEALDRSGEWRPIEYLSQSWCGNSYHRISLQAGRQWKFPAARYKGVFTTSLRFRLTGGGQEMVSNTFSGSINPLQFENKQPNEWHETWEVLR